MLKKSFRLHGAWHERTVLVGALVLTLIGSMLAQGPEARGFTRTDLWAYDWSLSFCIDTGGNHDAPIALADAEGALDDIIDHWEGPAGPRGSQALSISRNASGDPCTATVRIGTVTAAADGAFAAEVSGQKIITFEVEDLNNWTESQGAGQISFRSVLAHEMGHSMGLGHSGDFKWSGDSSRPTMASGIALGEGAFCQTPEQDDAGGAARIRGNGVHEFWSANPGFEDDLDFWTANRAGSGSSFKETGSKGANLFDDGGYVYLNSSYDPWDDQRGDVTTDMDDEPTITYFARIKADGTQTTGNLRIVTKTRHFNWLGEGLKYDDPNTSGWVGSWTSTSNVAVCTATTSWADCSGTRSFDLQKQLLFGDDYFYGVQMRLKVVNDHDVDVHIDEAGNYGKS